MIDNPEQTALFIEKLKAVLPIEANLPRELQQSLSSKASDTHIPATAQVVDAHYLGDFAGVTCCLDIGGDETKDLHLVSITQLRFSRRTPLFREIDTYQRRRAKKLRKENGGSFGPADLIIEPNRRPATGK